MASSFLTGLATGIVVGILFAPDKGSETRKKMAEATSDLKTKFNEFIDSISGKLDDLENEADDFASKAKAKFS